MSLRFCGLELAHEVINGSGTFDAIAARRAFGEALETGFPFAAYVSKTITLAPREGNPPPRLWEAPAGLVNSIGLPNRALRSARRPARDWFDAATTLHLAFRGVCSPIRVYSPGSMARSSLP